MKCDTEIPFNESTTSSLYNTAIMLIEERLVNESYELLRILVRQWISWDKESLYKKRKRSRAIQNWHKCIAIYYEFLVINGKHALAIALFEKELGEIEDQRDSFYYRDLYSDLLWTGNIFLGEAYAAAKKITKAVKCLEHVGSERVIGILFRNDNFDDIVSFFEENSPTTDSHLTYYFIALSMVGETEKSLTTIQRHIRNRKSSGQSFTKDDVFLYMSTFRRSSIACERILSEGYILDKLNDLHSIAIMLFGNWRSALVTFNRRWDENPDFIIKKMKKAHSPCVQTAIANGDYTRPINNEIVIQHIAEIKSKVDIEPPRDVYNKLLNVMGEFNWLDLVEELADIEQAYFSRELSVDVYSSMIREMMWFAYSLTGKHDEAIGIIRKSRGLPLSPRVATGQGFYPSDSTLSWDLDLYFTNLYYGTMDLLPDDIWWCFMGLQNRASFTPWIKKNVQAVIGFIQSEITKMWNKKGFRRIEYIIEKYHPPSGNWNEIWSGMCKRLPFSDEIIVDIPIMQLDRKIIRFAQSPDLISDITSIFVDFENKVRESVDLPVKGEGYISESSMVRHLEKYFDGHNLIREASPDWLGGMRFDAFIPDFNLAVEYQGEQHYRPVSIFNGEAGYIATVRRDKIKFILSEENGIKVEYIKFDDDILSRVKEIAKKHQRT